jgi:hypothetical protein
VNRCEILIKRSAATTYLSFGFYGTKSPENATLQLSKTIAGTTTNLVWRHITADKSGLGSWPLYPVGTSTYMKAWIDAVNVVHCQLWRGYPNESTPDMLIDYFTYTLLGSDITAFGSSAAHPPGLNMVKAYTGQVGGFAWDLLAPELWYYELGTVTPEYTFASSPVILGGEEYIDTWPTYTIRNGLVSPIIRTFNSEGDEGIMRFRAKLLEDIIVNTDTGTIKTASGENAYDLLLPGARFVPFTHGTNHVSLEATNFPPGLAAGAYMSIAHRDAVV